MKKFLKKKIISVLKFLDLNTRLKKQTSTPIDYYLDDDSSDGINKYDYEKDSYHGDTEFYDSSTSIKMRK